MPTAMYYETVGMVRLPVYHFVLVDHANDTYRECVGRDDDYRTHKVERLDGASDDDRVSKASNIARLYGASFVGIINDDGKTWHYAR